MANYRTHGYDMVLEADENSIEVLVGESMANQLGDFTGDIDDATASGHISFIPPAAGASPSTTSLTTDITDGIYLEFPFDVSVDIDNPDEWPRSGHFTGRFGITARLIILELSTTNACLALDFRELVRDEVAIVQLDTLAEDWRSWESEVRNLVENHVHVCLRDLPLTALTTINIPIDPDNDGSDPFTPIRLRLRVIQDGVSRSVAILYETQPNIPDNRDAFTATMLGPGDQNVLVIGNEVLLRRMIAARILTNLGLYNPPFDSLDVLHQLIDYHDRSATLATPTDISQLYDEWWVRRIELTTLTIEVTETEQLDIRGQINVYGEPVSGRINLHITGELVVHGGTIITHLHIEEPEVHISPTGTGFLVIGGLAFFIFAFRKVVSRIFFAFFENIFPTDDCTLVGLTDWPTEPQPVDMDCSWIPSPWPLVIDQVILDDCAVVGRLSISEADLDWPEPRIDIVGDWVATGGEFANVHTNTYEAGWGIVCDYHEGHHGEFRAIPSGPTLFPIVYSWCLGGHNLIGEGSVTISGTTVRYSTDGDRCELTIDSGDSLRSEICISAIDARNIEMHDVEPFDVQGSETIGGFFGIDVMEGPPPELEEQLFASQPARGVLFNQAEGTSLSNYKYMMRAALKRGMGVDPQDPNVRRGVEP